MGFNLKRKIPAFMAKLNDKLFRKIVYLDSRKRMRKDYARHIDNEYKTEIKKYYRNFNKKVNYKDFEYYCEITGVKDVRFISRDMFESEIFLYYNKYSLIESFSDKNYLSLNFPKAKQPIVLVRNIDGCFTDKNYNIISIETAINACMEQNEIIIKPSMNSCGGDGISFVKIENKSDSFKNKLREIFNSYGENYVIQEIFKQHEYMKLFNTTSINTVRVMSFLYKGNVYILSSILRFGETGNRLDNLCSGGTTIGINKDGYISDHGFKFNGKVGNGYLKSDDIFKKHPELKNSKFKFYDDVVDVVKETHPFMAHFKLISWDIAINQEGKPCIIECNLDFPEFISHQLFNGPIFGDLTEDVLHDVYGKN